MLLLDEWFAYQAWRDRFAAAVDPRFYPMGWLDAEVWSGRSRFWSNDGAAIVASLRVYPTGAREVHGLVAAGELEAIRRLIPYAEVWGRELGCITASIDSRAGWVRALRGDGYRIHQTALRKELA